jgi:hypothetical protein
MTGEEERAAIVAWLREGASFMRTFEPGVRYRLTIIWLALFRPGGLASASMKTSAEAIERGDHIPTGEER